MGIRYDNKRTIENQEEIYKEFREKRSANKIIHFSTSKMPLLTKEKRKNLNTVTHIWRFGDRYWNLAAKYYNDPSLWWLIAWYNSAPTESHVTLGANVFIPLPLDRVLGYYYGN